jgi:peptide/nickel transport system permease protein
MGRFLLRKSGAALVVIFVASVLVFIGIRAVPGDPAVVLAGDDPTQIPYYRHLYLLDRPLPVQYGRWLWLTVQGDLGRSHAGIPVAQTIEQRLPLTLQLATLSLLLAILIGVPAGMIAAVRRGRATDYAATGTAVVGHSIPHFWLGLMMILWFAVDLHWFPATGSGPALTHHPIGRLEHLVMPVIVLGVGFAAGLMRQTRAAMLNALSSDYIRTARSKGLSEWRVVGRHALRNSLITVTTLIALDFGILFSGAAITESVFGLPGFGRLGLEAFTSRDYATIQGIVLVTAFVYVVANFCADVVYSLLDPRIRISGAPS